MIFQSIIRKGQQKNVKIRIAQNLPNSKSSNYDTDFLKEQNLAEVSMPFTILNLSKRIAQMLFKFNDYVTL